jgi:LuxR family maltose regulon positive regulatory protein
MLHTQALADLLDGNAAAADMMFARAHEEAVDSNALPLAALVLAQRCMVAMDRGEWPVAADFSDRAARLVAEGRYDGYWTSALVYACASRIAVHRGQIDTGRRHLASAARLRPMLTYAIPAVSTQTLIEMARSYLSLSDPSGAAAVLMQAHDIIRQRPDLGSLPAAAETLHAKLAVARQSAIGSSSLTAAELRLLPLLGTHLSYGQIAERLTLSIHTVKSQAYSIYQKLGVSSRNDAVLRTRELGLAEV